MILPNVVIIGFPKCGTSSLFHWLASHPDVCGSVVKETGYLMDLDDRHLNKERNYHRQGLEGYGHFFEPAAHEHLYVESTPMYVYQETALKVLATLPNRTSPNRMPSTAVEATYSLFRFAKNNRGAIAKNLSFKSFIDHVRAGEHGPFARKPVLRDAIKESMYSRYLEAWIDRFRKDRILFLEFERMVQNERTVLRKVASFVGADPAFYDSFQFGRVNATYQFEAP